MPCSVLQVLGAVPLPLQNKACTSRFGLQAQVPGAEAVLLGLFRMLLAGDISKKACQVSQKLFLMLRSVSSCECALVHCLLCASHKWAGWLHNPCGVGGPHHFRAGGRIRGGPQVGWVAT